MISSSIYFPITSIYNKTHKKIFPKGDSYIAYEVLEKKVILAGDPKAKSLSEQLDVFKDFVNWSDKKNYKLCGYYFSAEFSKALCEKFNFFRFQIGTSSFIDLSNYNLVGNEYKEVRRAINHAKKNQLEFKEITECKTEYLKSIEQLSLDWEQNKKKSFFYKRIKFLLSRPQINFLNSENERWFIVKSKKGASDAFVSFLPYSLDNQHYYMDNMLQSPSGDKYAMDFLLSQVILKLKDENSKEICFGFNLARNLEKGRLIEVLFSYFFKTNFFYNAKGLGYFKNKFNTFEKKRYFIYSNKISILKALTAAYKVTFK